MPTASFVYVRMHGAAHEDLYGGSHSDEDLAWWAARMNSRVSAFGSRGNSVGPFLWRPIVSDTEERSESGYFESSNTFFLARFTLEVRDLQRSRDAGRDRQVEETQGS